MSVTDCTGAGRPHAALPFDRAAASAILEAARYREHGVLLENEAMALLETVGIPVPRRVVFSGSVVASQLDLPMFPGERAVLKVLAPQVLHKTEAGGVAIVPNDREAILEALAAMERRFAGQRIHGYMLCEYVPHDRAPGHELLLGMRWTEDFGPVVTLGAGGIATEFLAAAFREGQGLALFSPALVTGDAGIVQTLGALPLVRLVTASLRGRAPEADVATLADLVRRFLAVAEAFMPGPIGEFEVNPLVLSNGRFVALDALLKLATAPRHHAPPRPLDKLARLLQPRSIAVMGVSEKLNPGRVILQNILKSGFDREAVTVVKPGLPSLDGCRCVPDIPAIPDRVDLLILSIGAAQVPDALAAAIENERAESVILITSGLGEKAGSEPLVAEMQRTLARARAATWQGPVINGGNCLGIRSVPGRYNTLFIPEHKFPVPRGIESPLAFIAGSGAFVVAKTSKLVGLNPRYLVSIGNQMDLTIGDYLEALKADTALDVFAIYAEGFRPCDGLRVLRAAREITDSGRTVILYRGGRTRAGAVAAASHTASIAGDYAVMRALAAQAGVIVAESLEEFEDLVALCVRLHGRAPAGSRLGACSNAGFESVAIADNLGALALADFSPDTVEGLTRLLERARLEGIVTVRNPIDLTPILDDEHFADVARVILEDPGVELGLVGCVPMTGALTTLAPAPGHDEDVRSPDSVASRLVRLWHDSVKPWVAVVDAGRLYDPMAEWLEAGGIPTFRTADRALARLNRWWAEARRREAARRRAPPRPKKEEHALTP